MSTELSTALVPLAGVLLGGGLSYIVQSATWRSTERAEASRREAARAETRRTERMAAIDRFITSAVDAERLANDRHLYDAQGAEWQNNANAAMGRVWVAEKMIRILCTPTLDEAAGVFTTALEEAIYKSSPGDIDIFAYLKPGRTSFLNAARIELEMLDPDQDPPDGGRVLGGNSWLASDPGNGAHRHRLGRDDARPCRLTSASGFAER